MKIKDLIEELKQYDENTTVITWDCYTDNVTTAVNLSDLKKQDGELCLIICSTSF